MQLFVREAFVMTYNSTTKRSHKWRQLMMPKKSPVSHTVPTRSTPDLPNIEKDLTESTGVVLAKDPPKVKSEESSNNVREYEL